MGKPRKEWKKNEHGRYEDPNQPSAQVRSEHGPDEAGADGERGGGGKINLEPFLTRSGKNHKQFASLCRITDSSQLPEGKLKQICQTRWTEEYAYEIASKLIEYTDSSEVPLLSEFLSHHHIHRQQFARMRERHFFVADAADYCLQSQESKLIKHGLKRGNNPTMAIFTLKNNHKWKEKQPEEVTQNNFTFSMPDMVKRIIDKVEARQIEEKPQD